MKLALLLLFISFPIFADEMDSPPMHFFVVPSPSNTCFAVQTVLRWKGSDNISQYGRLQLCRTNSGAELWRINHVLCLANDVFPSDDLHHLALVRSHFRTHGPDSMPVLLFYSDGKLLKSYTLKELNFDLGKLDSSISHSDFVKISRAENNGWAWDWPLGTAAATQNTHFEVPDENPQWHDAIFDIIMLDGQRLRFDARTGRQLKSK